MSGDYNKGSLSSWTHEFRAAFPCMQVVHKISLTGADALAVICSTAPILLEHGAELKAVEARTDAGSAMITYHLRTSDDLILSDLLKRLRSLGTVCELTVSSYARRVAQTIKRQG